MPVKLTTPATHFDTTDGRFEQMLRNLQANILKPHGRNHARHVFLRFTGDPLAVKAWIRGLSVTSAWEQFNPANKEDKGSGRISSGFMLSASGYEYLGFDTSLFASESFRSGMKAQQSGVFSQFTDQDNEDPDPSTWEFAFRGDIHALATFAHKEEEPAELAAETLRQSSAGVASIVVTEKGHVLRRGTEPIEHFGYFDGISQPIFTKADLEKELLSNPDKAAWDPSARLNLVLVDDPQIDVVDAFGSYLVYRKLHQDVGRFEAAVSALAKRVGVSEELAGAMVVGRFKDGTPLVRSQTPAAAGAFSKTNDFNYADEDAGGSKCPFHSHIRKTNPRGTTPLTTLEDEKSRRIARRGIPYGPEGSDPATPRGLLFMCFQANVERQFEFIQRTWVDNRHFPTSLTSILTLGLLGKDTGDDPVIGQDPAGVQRWPRAWDDPESERVEVHFRDVVTLKGGEYFFAPSLPFLSAL